MIDEHSDNQPSQQPEIPPSGAAGDNSPPGHFGRRRAWFRRLNAFRRVLVRLTVLLSFVTAGLFSWAVAREMRMIKAQPITSWMEDQSADCGVVVTGGPNRIREGFDLLARRSIQKLIISGVHPQAELREIFPQMPFYGEIREQDVVLERRSRTTYGNAQQSLPLVEALRCRDIILITSRVHIYRAYRTFRAEFPSRVQIQPRAVVAGTAEPLWTDVFGESLKSVFYSLWAY